MSDSLLKKVWKFLAEIPGLYYEARHYLIPGSAPIDPTTSVRGASVYRIPISADIFDLLDLRDKDVGDVIGIRSGVIWQDGAGRRVVEPAQRRLGVLPTLGLWVSLVWAELDDLGRTPRECCPAREHTVAGEAGWLHEYAHEIVELHPDFPREIELLYGELRKACRVRREYVPTCPACATATRRSRVEAIYGDDASAPAWWRCTACEKTWVADAEVRRFALTQPPMTLREMANFLDLPLRDLYRIRDAQRLVPVGRSGRGGGLYEVEQVRRAVEKVGKNVA